MANFFLFAYFFHAALFVQPVETAGVSSQATYLIEELRQELIADRFGSLFNTLAVRQGFNGNVLLSHDGKVVYKNSFGYADLKQRTPLSIGSVFQLASVSKQFTSAAIMLLHDQGKLDFNDPIQKYFPDLPYKDVTIRHLLSHRSGIPDYMNFAGKFWKNKRVYMTNADLLEMFTDHHLRLEFTPGERYKYSNSGYALLASLIEKLSGQSYGEFMECHVFAPLGMFSSFVSDPNKPQLPLFQTTGHNKDRVPAHEDFLSGVVGDKGIYSTVEDMYKWDQALYTESLVRQSTLEEAFTPASSRSSDENGYGYGWRITTSDRGEKIIYHAGWWRGYNSLCVRRLVDKTFIIVLSNKVNWCFRDIDQLLKTIDAAAPHALAVNSRPFYKMRGGT